MTSRTWAPEFQVRNVQYDAGSFRGRGIVSRVVLTLWKSLTPDSKPTVVCG